MGSLIPLNLYSNAAGATLLISDKRRQIPLTQSSSELVKCGVKGFRYCNLRGLPLRHQNYTHVAAGFFIKDAAIVGPLSSTHLVCS